MPSQQPSVSDLEERAALSNVLCRAARFRDRLENARLGLLDSSTLLAIAILLYVALTSASISRHMWFDELFTYWIAKAPSISKLLNYVYLDLQPPLSYLLVRWSLAVFGDNELATRLPFALGFLVGSLCFYRFISRRLGSVYGLLGMFVFWSTPFFAYATEARPYGLIVGFFGVAMLAWQRAIEPIRSKPALVVFALAVLGMMCSHFFAVFYLIPFGLAELWRWYRSGKFDGPIWSALLLPIAVPLYYFSRAKAYAGMALPPVQQASPFKIGAFFYHTLEPEGAILLLAVLIGLAVVFRRDRAQVERVAVMKPVELMFTTGLLAIPFVIVFTVMEIHGAFFPRYAIPTLFAYGLLLAFFVAMYTNANRLAAVAASFVLLVSLAGSTAVSATLTTLRTWGKKNVVTVREPPLEKVRPDLPLVAASGLTFLEMNKYEGASTLARLYYLSDRDLALRYAHATLFEGPFEQLGKYFPLRGHFASYGQFVAEHPHFLVVGTPSYAEDWLIPRLLDIHAKLQYLGTFAIPYKDQQIFEVTMPDAR